ncbi:MAG: hypothetical protein GY719_30810 [bacterium]|nr:hypothetical protein [bacterium]
MTKRSRWISLLILLALLLALLVRYAPRLFPTLDLRSGFLPRARAVEWVWTGALRPTSMRAVARLTRPSDRVRLLVGRDETLADPVASAYQATDEAAGLLVRMAVDDLEPGVRYHYALEVDDEVDRARRGAFRTPREGPQSFTFAFGSCAQTGSSHPVFGTIRRHDPLFLLHLGDLHYENIERADPALYRRAFDRVLKSAGQSRLFRAVPVAYVWDDHDFGPDNADSSSPGGAAAQRVYRQAVPHYPLATDDGPIFQAFTIGRVRFLLTDSRSEKTPRAKPDRPGKTVLGAAQKRWLEQELLDARDRYALIVWANSMPWIGEPLEGADHWGGYHTERLELARFIEANGIRQLVMLSGDAHMMAIDDGSHNRLTASGGPGFPVMHAAAFDRSASVKGGPYSSGVFPGPGQFGLMTVEDDGGETVTVRWSGRDHRDRELLSHSFVVGESGMR